MTRPAHALTAVLAGLMLCFSTVAAATTAAEGKQHAEQFLRGLESLQARFKQTLTDSVGEVVDESNGTLAIKRPNRFRWNYVEPHEQAIVSDGERIWLYDRDLEQVTVRKLDVALSSTPAMLLSGAGTLTDNFTVSEVIERAGVLWVRMQPKRNDTDFKSVALGFAGSKSQELRFMELADKLGQTTLLEFSNLERNPALDAALFVFKVPPGADVIGDTGEAGAARPNVR